MGKRAVLAHAGCMAAVRYHAQCGGALSVQCGGALRSLEGSAARREQVPVPPLRSPPPYMEEERFRREYYGGSG